MSRLARKLLPLLVSLAAPASAQPAPEAAPAQPAPAAQPAPEAAPAQPAPAPAPAPAPVEAPAAQPAEAHPLAGFGNESFYLRSADDNFILIPSGRLQMDWYGYQGGVNQPYNTFNIKRARIEAFGTIMKHWDFQLGSEFTNTSAPISTDIWLNANYTNWANFQVGQFDAPFTMENRTSDKWTDMQERSRVVSAFAIPENKEIGAMVWGQPPNKWAYWSGGIFNGEGQNLFKHTSNSFDVMGRAWIAPGGIAGIDLIKNIWVGGSYWNGFRNVPTKGFTNQNDRKAMTDEAGFTFFNPVYGNIHSGTYGQQNKWGLELNAPIGPVVVKGEYVNVDEGLRELDLTNASKPTYVRTAKLSGSGFYGRVSYFVWGDSLINGLGGMQNPPRLFGDLKPGKTADALQIVANVDHIGFSYAADDGASNSKDKLVGDYGFNAYGLGVNYWYTKHIRLTGNFIYEAFEGNGPHPLASSNNSYEFTLRAALAL